MKCPGNEILQTYIDGELDIGIKKEVEGHLLTCAKCSDALNVLKENDDFVFNKLSGYKRFWDELPAPAAAAPKPGQPEKPIPLHEKGVPYFMTLLSKYKKIAASACALVLVTTCVTVQPIRAAISDALSIFRVENVKGITVTMEDLYQIRDKLKQKNSELNLDNIGKIKRSGGEQKRISNEEALNLPDFHVSFPSQLADVRPDIMTMEPATMEFTLNVANLNEILKSLGAKKTLPESADGKTLRINFPRQVVLKYTNGDKSYTVTQTKSPELQVPEEVNVDEIYNSMIELPILPEDIQRQLKSIKDWKNTLYIPVIDKQTEEVDINGVKGFLYTQENPRTNTVQSWLVWYTNGVATGIQGNMDKDEAITLARSMR